MNGSSERLDRTYTRRHPHSLPCGGSARRPFPSSLSRGMVHLSVRDERPAPYEGVGFVVANMDPLGFEPRASALQRRHSPAELRARR